MQILANYIIMYLWVEKSYHSKGVLLGSNVVLIIITVNVDISRRTYFCVS